MRKITQTIVGTTPPLDKNVIWLDNTDSTAPVEKVFINGEWTPMGVDTDDYYTKEEVDDKLDEKLNVIENPVNGNLVTMNSQGQVTNSGKKTTDFIATPIDSGSEGEVLSVDSEGNPVWTTVTPTGTADTEMSDTSTNAVQNKVIKSYVDNNFANKDGYYSTLTAGSAENLVGQTVDSEAYLIRPTGGAENEVANGVASVLGMEGNSAVWSQLTHGDFSTGWSQYNFTSTKSVTDGILTITANATNFDYHHVIDIPSGHKYLVCFSTKGLSGNSSLLLLINRTTKIATVPRNNNNWVSYCNIFQASTNITRIGFQQDGSAMFQKFMVINLTLLGIDNLTTTTQVRAWLAQHPGLKPYYAYNAGTILSAQTLGIKTYGQNLLNPTTRQAKLIPYTWVEDGTTYSNQYTIKNVPSGATATFTPDNTGVAETVDISGGSLDITSYGSGILELSAATANTYICIKWNGTKDNDVVPYEDHTYDFDVRKVYGKNNGAGEYVQCFQSGMRSAGSVHDTLSASEAVVKVGSTKLGDYTYSSDTVGGYLRFNSTTAISPRPKQGSNYRFSNQINSYGYINNGAPIAGNATDRSISNYGYYLYVRDDRYSSTTAFKTAMSEGNITIYYELATPITYTDLIYRDNGVDRPLADVLMNITVNNWSMEEQLMTPYEDGNPTSIPATIKTQYGMDAVEAIDTLQKTCYFADDVHANLQALLTCINTNCAETLGGTFAISDTATDKVFAFSFTPNVEPTNEGE